ncbi:MAG: hypothetical protein H7X95_02510, partial [Deltaproteobacteria bacterium]|nr:hypothetical protein [Deltaproteobacteria bacterium]
MSLPRAIIPGRTYMITRRCSERRFFLRPDRRTNNAFIYCLAVAAQAYEVKVVFTVAMSNHHHTGVVDVHGNLPEFLAYFHKLFAKHQNALRGRWEAFWAPEQTSMVQLVEGEDILDKMVYALTNPVKDHLVAKVHHWPGVNSLSAVLKDEPLRATRPRTFFRADGDMPESVELRFHRPDTLKKACPSGVASVLEERVADAEKQADQHRVETGKGIVGRAGVLNQDWRESPQTREPRRQLDPRVACRNTWRRVEALMRNRRWVASYRVAREQFVAGVRTALFPIG